MKPRIQWFAGAVGTLAVGFIVSAAASATQAPVKPAEMKKVVDSFAGKWEMQATATLPGEEKPVRFKLVSDCRKIALDSGVDCTMSGNAGKMGPMAQNCLVAYDPEGTGVHMMCVTSTGEVHDHKGAWKNDKTIEFEPLKTTMEGKPATEALSATWSDASHMTVRSVTTSEGSRVVFEFVGKRI